MSIAYCEDMVRRYDPDRSATVIFAASGARRALWALFAFNLEVAKIRETVSEPLLGQIRLQWWRETLDSMAEGQTPKHEVAEALGGEITLDRDAMTEFGRLLAAREFDMEDRPAADFDELAAYARETSAPLLRLALRATAETDAAIFEAAEDLGAAWALTGLARAVPFHRAEGRPMLPQSATVEDVGGLAEAALDAFRRKMGGTGVARRAPLLLAPLTRHYLNALRNAGFEPRKINRERGAAARFLRLWWAHGTGRW